MKKNVLKNHCFRVTNEQPSIGSSSIILYLFQFKKFRDNILEHAKQT